MWRADLSHWPRFCSYHWRRASDIRDVDHSESTPMAPLAVKLNNMVYQRISLGAGWLMAVTLG